MNKYFKTMMNVLVGIFCLSCIGAGCATAIHTTEVIPGVQIDVVGGAGSGIGTRDTMPIVQLDLGYAWKFKNVPALQGLQIKVDLPLCIPPTSLIYTTADVYIQFLDAPLDVGAGIQLGVMPGVYAQIGKGFYSGNTRFGIDVGIRGRLNFFAESSSDEHQEQTGILIDPFLLLSLQASFFRMGVWAEFVYQLNGTLDFCIDNCSNDHRTNAFLMGGLLIGFTF